MCFLLIATGCGVQAVAQQQDQGDEEVFSSPLQRALRKGLAPDGDFDEALTALGDYKVHSKKDATAIVDALSRLPAADIKTTGYKSPIYSLMSLFQDVDAPDAPAIEVLRSAGIDELVRIFDELKLSPDEDTQDDLLFLLKILAMYGTHEGAEKVVEAARIPLKPDGYLWSVILGMFREGHPEQDFVFRSLSHPLPPQFIAVSLLDSTNRAAIEEGLGDHPFACEQGQAQLRAWLTSRNPNEFSYAHSATAALPFLPESIRNELLGLAREHTDAGVRLEAAWASAKVGQAIGWQMLRDACLDINQSSTAVQYLTELEREDLIPSEASEPSFQAKAEFANWLAHPNELGRVPDELEILDHRTIYWPPAQEERTLWLIKYRVVDSWGLEPDDVDCGLVGGNTTWCFFYRNMHQRLTEDCYAIHCSWELGLESSEVDDIAEYQPMLAQWPHEPLEKVEEIHVVEIPPQLKYGRGLVAVATATCRGETGWAVLDGSDSLWYPASAMPTGESAWKVVSLHVGRKLLGFPPAQNRRRILDHIPQPLTPDAVVDAYDKLLEQCKTGSLDQKQSLLEDWHSPLVSNSVRYAEACESVGREVKSEALVRTFSTIFGAIAALPEHLKSKACDFSLSDKFDEYIDAMVATGRANELPALVALLEPHCDHNMGYRKLGGMAYKGQDFSAAERLLLKLKEPDSDWYRVKEMSLLARIWHKQGKTQEASELLIACLQGLVKEVQEATYASDRKMFEEECQHHRKTFMDLFPGDTARLKQLDLPESTLNRG